MHPTHSGRVALGQMYLGVDRAVLFCSADLRRRTEMRAASRTDDGDADYRCAGVVDEEEINAARRFVRLAYGGGGGDGGGLGGGSTLSHPVRLGGSITQLEGEGRSTVLDGFGITEFRSKFQVRDLVTRYDMPTVERYVAAARRPVTGAATTPTRRYRTRTCRRIWRPTGSSGPERRRRTPAQRCGIGDIGAVSPRSGNVDGGPELGAGGLGVGVDDVYVGRVGRAEADPEEPLGVSVGDLAEGSLTGGDKGG